MRFICDVTLMCFHGPQIVDGASIVAVCKFGDTVVEQACAGIYQKKVKGVAIEKGVAFPTYVSVRSILFIVQVATLTPNHFLTPTLRCISINEVVCHNCPLETDGDGGNIKAGDMVKIDVGVHVDGACEWSLVDPPHTLVLSHLTPPPPHHCHARLHLCGGGHGQVRGCAHR